jgi:hypothetical protein
MGWNDAAFVASIQVCSSNFSNSSIETNIVFAPTNFDREDEPDVICDKWLFDSLANPMTAM